MRILLALAVLALPYLGFSALSDIPIFDDDGTLMITFRDIMDGRILYHDIFALYGPFYYIVITPLFSVFHIPLWHDSVRLISASFWLLASLTLGSFVYRFSGSKPAGAFAMLTALFSLQYYIVSPMHPQELGFLLVGVLLHLIYLIENETKPVPLAIVGVIFGGLLLTKINLGIFIALPVLLAALRVTGDHKILRVAHAAALVAGLLMPLALMGPMFQFPWAVESCLFATATIMAASIAWFGAKLPHVLRFHHWAFVLGGFAAVVAVVLGVVLAGGTTAFEVLDATILQSAGFAQRWHAIPPLSGYALVFAASGLGTSVFFVFGQKLRFLRGFALGGVVWLKAATVVVWVAVIVIAALFDVPWRILPTLMFEGLLPFAWLLVVPPVHGEQRPLTRGTLGMIAAYLGLYAFPIAGAQLLFGPLLIAIMLPVFALDVIADVRVVLGGRVFSALNIPLCLSGKAPVVAIAYAVFAAMLMSQTTRSIVHYRSLVPIALPGAALVRAKAEIVDDFHWAVAKLSRCKASYTVPGQLSLYFWTNQRPPTGLNNNNMLALLNDTKQRQVVSELEEQPDLCILTHPKLQEFFDRGQMAARPPIVRYIEENFIESESNGTFHLLRRRN